MATSGLTIEPHRGEDARRGPSSRGAAAEPLRLPGLRHEPPPLGGSVSRLRRLGHTRRDRRARALRGRPSSPRAIDRAVSPRPCAPSLPRMSNGARPASRSSIASSAAGSCQAPSCCSAASRASASRRSCCEAAAGIADRDGTVLYASGEESAGQLRLRAGRLGLTEGPAADAVHVLAEIDVERIIEAAPSAGRRPCSSSTRCRR